MITTSPPHQKTNTIIAAMTPRIFGGSSTTSPIWTGPSDWLPTCTLDVA